jgi:hypothetical protein
VSKVNQRFNKMAAVKVFYVKCIIVSIIIHRTSSREGINTTTEPSHQFFLQSLIGSEEIVPEQLISKI